MKNTTTGNKILMEIKDHLHNALLEIECDDLFDDFWEVLNRETFTDNGRGDSASDVIDYFLLENR